MKQSKAVFRVSRRKNALWTLFFQYSSLFVSFIKGVVLVPLYLKYIDVELYGYWLSMSGFLVWLFILDPGFADVIRQRVAQAFGAKDLTLLGGICTCGLLFSALLTVSICLVGYLGAYWVPCLLKVASPDYADDLVTAFRVTMLGNGLLIMGLAFSGISIGLQSGRSTGTIALIANVVGVLVLAVALFADLQLLALALSAFAFGMTQLLAQGVNALLILHRMGVRLCFDWKFGGDLLKASAVNFYGKTAKSLSQGMDSFFVVRLLGPEAVVAFELTRRGPNFGRMIIGRIGNALTSPISHLHGEGAAEKLKSYATRIIQVVCWPIVLFSSGFIALNEMFMDLWVGPGHYLGFGLNVMIVFWICLLVMFNLMNILIFSLGEVESTSNTHLFTGLLLIPVMYWATMKFGMWGLVVSAVSVFGGCSMLRQWPQYVKMFGLGLVERRLIIREILLAITASCMCISIVSFISLSPSWWHLILKATAVVFVVLILAVVLSESVRKACGAIWFKISKVGLRGIGI